MHLSFWVCPLVIFSVLLATGLTATHAAEPETIRVMSFNIWVGGEAGKQPLSQTAQVIKAAGADIVGLQESRGEERNGKRPDNAKVVADQLGWNHFSQGEGSTTIITRYKIVGHTPKKWGAKIELPAGRAVWMFNAHLAYTPYQPYQLLKIPYNDAPFITTGEEAVSEANKARAEQVAGMLAEIESVRDQKTPIFVTGDFNEPSPLDWTEAATKAGLCPVVVKWPTAGAVLQAGFVDSYREIHPDPVKFPGITWTPLTEDNDPGDHHDRIDFILVGGVGAKVKAAEVVGEKQSRADIVVSPYPSDHRGVVATILLK